jgi:mannose-6-phosphate isomerase-like protein (cupin superfamily)
MRVYFPCDECDARVEIIKVGQDGYESTLDRDAVVKVLSGKGKITIEGSIEVDLAPPYSFVFPSGIKSLISSKNMILMRFD